MRLDIQGIRIKRVIIDNKRLNERDEVGSEIESNSRLEEAESSV